MKSLLVKSLVVLGLALIAVMGNGCATPDKTENASERPWNSPQGWGKRHPQQPLSVSLSHGSVVEPALRRRQ